jgi:hypothetical protein
MNHGMVIEFDVDKETMSQIHFDLLSDLAAEAWYKGISRWRNSHKTAPNLTTQAPESAVQKKISDANLPAREKIAKSPSLTH